MSHDINIKNSSIGCLGVIGLAVLLAILIPAFWFGGCCAFLGLGLGAAQQAQQPVSETPGIAEVAPTRGEPNVSPGARVPLPDQGDSNAQTRPSSAVRQAVGQGRWDAPLKARIALLEQQMAVAEREKEDAKLAVVAARKALSEVAAMAGTKLTTDPDFLDAAKTVDDAESRVRDLQGRATPAEVASASARLSEAKEELKSIAAAKTKAAMEDARTAFEESRLRAESADARRLQLEEALAHARQQLTEGVIALAKRQKAQALLELAKRPITYSQFQQIGDGMTYDQVVQILGRDGKEVSRLTVEGYTDLLPKS